MPQSPAFAANWLIHHGVSDSLLKIVVRDIAAYDSVCRRIINGAGLGDVGSSFAMERLEDTTRLPLDCLDQGPGA
jgi:Lrp/AsnC family transcriptional regulator